VPDADAGVASAMVNTGQQIGTSIGTALLNALVIAATTRYLTTRTLDGGRPGSGLASLALIHGCTIALWWAAGILAAGAILSGTPAAPRRPGRAGRLRPGKRPRPSARNSRSPPRVTATKRSSIVRLHALWRQLDYL